MESVFLKKFLSTVSAAAMTLTSLGIQPFFEADAASGLSHEESAALCEEHDHCHENEHEDIHDHSHEETALHDNCGGKNVKIALLDTGVTEYSVEKSVSFVDDDTIDSNHGNNMMSILGSAVPYADVFDVRVLDDNGSGTHDSVYKGIVWAVDNSADIIVMSFAGDKQSALLEEALAYAEENNVFVVASAGNNSAETACFPAAYPTVISVGAVDECGDVHDYSNFGSYVDTYVQWDDGTSGAAQYIAADAAIAIEHNPEIEVSELRALFKTTEYEEFSACTEDNADSLVSAACSHSFNGQFTTTQATCTEPAKKIGRCTKCNAIVSSSVISPALGHSYGSWITSKSATCTAAGSKYRTCSRCSSKEYGTISAKGHSYGSWSISKSATCISTGSKYRVCSSCNNKETQTIAKTSHTYKWVITTNPTCAKEGVKKYTCSYCGNVSQTASVSKTSHTFNGQYTTTKQPTCTEKGLKEGKCTKCSSVVSTVEIEATGHSYSWVVTTNPTCAKEGVKKYTCSKCGNVSQTASVSKTSHTFNGQYTTTKQPTCTEKGLKEGKCTKCSSVVSTVEIEATGHSYSWVVTKAATCSAEGIKSYKCSKCGDVSKTETTAKLSHTFNGQYTTTEPTCTKDGSKVGKCTVCGSVVSSTVLKATGHNYDKLYMSKEATCTSYGYKIYKCSNNNCSAGKTISVSPTGHTFNGQFTIVRKPTCKDTGLKVGRCTKCSNIVTSSSIPTTDHTYGEWKTVQEATCTAYGSRYRQCTVCDKGYTESISPKKHQFNGSFERKDPTCENDGYIKGRCINCSQVLTNIVIPKLGGSHNFNGSFNVVKEATCTEEGLRVGKCTRCTTIVTSFVIEATGHNFEIVQTVPPTEKMTGIEEERCTNCGLVKSSQELEKVEFTIEDCGYTGFNFCADGEFDDCHSWPLYGGLGDDSRLYLLLEFTTNYDWTVTAADSYIHTVNYDGNRCNTGGAGTNYIIVYLDEFPSTSDEKMRYSSITISTAGVSKTYSICQNNYYINGYEKKTYAEQTKIKDLCLMLGENSDAAKTIRGEIYTHGEIIKYKIDNYRTIAISTIQTDTSDLSIEYIIFEAVDTTIDDTMKAIIDVKETRGMKLEQGSSPLFTTTAKISGNYADVTDENYENAVRTGETWTGIISTGASIGVGFIPGLGPIMSFLTGAAVDGTISATSHFIIKANTVDNGNTGIYTTTTYSIENGCTFKNSDDCVEIFCNAENIENADIEIDFNIVNSVGTSIPF